VSGQATTTIGGAAAAVAAAVAAQKFDRSRSVRKDLALDLPPCLGLPDGEERPYGAANRMRIRAYDQVCLLLNSLQLIFVHRFQINELHIAVLKQESEIYQECIRPPPNRTVQKQQQNDCSSFLPFRCNSEGILASGTAGSSSPRTISPKGLASHSSPSSILTVCCPASSTSSSTASLLGSLSSSSSGSSSGGVCPFSSTRLLLDMNGQPIVTRSKSMSTGSPHPPPLAVMVPMMNRSLESTTPMPTTSNRSPPGQELCSSTRSKLASLPVVSCATSSNSSND